MSLFKSIKFLFNFLEPTSATILSRASVFCLNHTKSVGIHDADTIDQPQSRSDKVDLLLDTILSTNLTRSLDIKLKSVIANGIIDLDWFKSEHCQQLTKDEIVIAWIYHARQVYTDSTPSSTQKLLNILSNALEASPHCELVWLVYLRVYLAQKNAMKDYHEICLLCLDNLVTYDLAWFVLNTCAVEHTSLLIEFYEKHLLAMTTDKQIEEFEQGSYGSTQTVTSKVSFYLMEVMFFAVNVKVGWCFCFYFLNMKNASSGIYTFKIAVLKCDREHC